MYPPRFAAFALFGIVVAFVSTVGQRGIAAPVPKHLMKTPETDKAKFQGKWKVQSVLMGGKDILVGLGQGGGLGLDMIFEFQGDQLIATTNIGGTTQKTTTTLKFGANGKRELVSTESHTVDGNGKPINAGPDEQKGGSTGYAFDGEKLLLGASSNGQTAVDPLKPGKDDIVIVLVRAK